MEEGPQRGATRTDPYRFGGYAARHYEAQYFIVSSMRMCNVTPRRACDDRPLVATVRCCSCFRCSSIEIYSVFPNGFPIYSYLTGMVQCVLDSFQSPVFLG